MSLRLRGTRPPGLEVKTLDIGGCPVVFLGDHEIPLEQFLVAAQYVLENTDLAPAGDPRLVFAKIVRSMRMVKGYNPGGKRLESGELSELP